MAEVRLESMARRASAVPAHRTIHAYWRRTEHVQKAGTIRLFIFGPNNRPDVNEWTI